MVVPPRSERTIIYRSAGGESGTSLSQHRKKGLRPFLERAKASIERDLEGKASKVAVKGVLELRGKCFTSICSLSRRIS